MLVLSSLIKRPVRYLACFLAVFLGSLVIMAFASMLDTAEGPEVPAQSVETLEVMATVVGSWGLWLVLFAVLSTMSLSVRQRAGEMALLRNSGATPGQVGWMIVGETAIVSLIASALALVPAMFLGQVLFDLLVEAGQVDPGVEYAFGPVAIAMGSGNAMMGALLGAWLTARQTARLTAAEALLDSRIGHRPMARWRVWAAAAAAIASVMLIVVTLTAMDGSGVDAMRTASPAAILCAAALALLSPVLVRAASRVLGPVLRLGGISGRMAELNVRGRTEQLAGAVMPALVFTAIAAGTLAMQHVENTEIEKEDVLTTVHQENLETLNYVTIGVIAGFCCIMMINTLVAATAHRRREFGQQRLAGATPGQVLRMVAGEGLVLSTTGVVCGVAASLAALVPFTISRTGSAVPDAGVWVPYAGVIAVAIVVTLGVSVGTARRTIRRGRAIEAVLAA